jgi:hypothetical protein
LRGFVSERAGCLAEKNASPALGVPLRLRSAGKTGRFQKTAPSARTPAETSKTSTGGKTGNLRVAVWRIQWVEHPPDPTPSVPGAQLPTPCFRPGTLGDQKKAPGTLIPNSEVSERDYFHAEARGTRRVFWKLPNPKALHFRPFSDAAGTSVFGLIAPRPCERRSRRFFTAPKARR